MEVHDHACVSSDAICGSVVHLGETTVATECPQHISECFTLSLANRPLNVVPSGQLRIREAGECQISKDHVRAHSSFAQG
jgi:hypothetical protein